MSQDRFKILFSNWKDITPDTADFYFSQAEKRLIETLETSKNITSSTHKLISIFFPLFLLLSGYLIKSIDSINSQVSINSWFYFAGFITALIIIRCLFVCVSIIKPRKLLTTGSMPKLMINKEPIDRHGTSSYQLLDIILVECENYQKRIDKNIELNTEKARKLHLVYQLISVCLPSILVLLFILHLLFYFST